MPAQIKLKLICECCGCEMPQLEIVKKYFMYCDECVIADKRRQRFLDEEEEWNRGVDQQDTN